MTKMKTRVRRVKAKKMVRGKREERAAAKALIWQMVESVADLAAPATEVGDLYCTAWREVSTQTQPTPRALRRSA